MTERTAAPRSGKGFAGMTAARQREIASMGGKASQALGTAHRYDAAEASAAGRKGGLSVSQRREWMATIGRKGGLARARRAAAQRDAYEATLPLELP